MRAARIVTRSTTSCSGGSERKRVHLIAPGWPRRRTPAREAVRGSAGTAGRGPSRPEARRRSAPRSPGPATRASVRRTGRETTRTSAAVTPAIAPPSFGWRSASRTQPSRRTRAHSPVRPRTLVEIPGWSVATTGPPAVALRPVSRAISNASGPVTAAGSAGPRRARASEPVSAGFCGRTLGPPRGCLHGAPRHPALPPHPTPFPLLPHSLQQCSLAGSADHRSIGRPAEVLPFLLTHDQIEAVAPRRLGGGGVNPPLDRHLAPVPLGGAGVDRRARGQGDERGPLGLPVEVRGCGKGLLLILRSEGPGEQEEGQHAGW